jgi:8-oxo-dGTP pyrophosphatase MutT (NUDIX family)
MIETLHTNKWVSLLSRDGYVFSHETRCNGNIVAVLPFRRIPWDGGSTREQFLVRREITPAWGQRPRLSALTGGCDDPTKSPLQIAAMELEQEAGFIIDPAKFIFLGRCRGSKSNSALYHLFAVDTTTTEQFTALGDGTVGEQNSSTEWVMCWSKPRRGRGATTAASTR